MARIWISAACVVLLMQWVSATVAGKTEAYSRYFILQHENTEYDAERPSPARTARVMEVTRHWQLFTRIYRAVDRNPRVRAALRRERPVIDDMYHTGNILQYFSGRGLAARAIEREPTEVYTLQLAAFAHRRSLASLTRHFWTSRRYNPGTRIYRETPKNYRLDFGNESLNYKDDPIYLTRVSGYLRARYGLYESPEDARRDAVEWRRRYHVSPVIVRVPLTPTLVRNVIWGDVPDFFRFLH